MLKANQNNNPFGKTVVVIALLDWGLGHITRSVPIIRHLINKNCHLIIACTPVQKSLLVREFGDLSYVNCEGYDISYRKSAWWTRFSLFLQSPKILIKIKREHKWLKQFLQQNRADLVVSDNRYGFYSSSVPSIIITHQLQIKSGFGSWIDRPLNAINRSRLAKFSECWVPDFEGTPNIAGELSHPIAIMNLPLRYLGALSRMSECDTPPSRKPNTVLMVLSGPEPQRSLLEKQLLKEASTLNNIKFILVRGLPNTSTGLTDLPSNVESFNHLTAESLNKLVCSSELLICRSGYTSLMDYLKLGAKCILIPTPGQAEQEYLARYTESSQLAIASSQPGFALSESIAKARVFPFKKFTANMELYKDRINDFLQTVSKD